MAASTFSVVGTPTLGQALQINISSDSSKYWHEIFMKVENESEELVTTKTGGGTVSIPTDLEWAGLVKYSSNVKVQIRIITWTASDYNGNAVGSTKQTINVQIPDSVAPECFISVTDTTDYESIYGSFVKGLSELKIYVSAKTAYGSPIQSYKVEVGDSIYTKSSSIVDTSNLMGEVTITATVTDGRGKTSTATATVTVIEKAIPSITKLSVHRCDADGSENIQGEYCLVTFSSEVINAIGGTSVNYTLKSKKTSEAEFAEIILSELQNKISVTDKTYIFEAESGSAYEVELCVACDDALSKKSTKLSTAFSILHFHKSGTGLGIGCVAETENLLEVGIGAKFKENVEIAGLARFSGDVEFDKHVTGMRVLHNMVGRIFDSEDGTVEGKGIATLAIYMNGLVRVDFSVKITTAGTVTTSNYGLNWDLISDGFDDVPEKITLFNSGTWLQIREDGTVRFDSAAFGNYMSNRGNRWGLGVIVQNTAGTGFNRNTYYETFCNENRIIQGTCYGYIE